MRFARVGRQIEYGEKKSFSYNILFFLRASCVIIIPDRGKKISTYNVCIYSSRIL